MLFFVEGEWSFIYLACARKISMIRRELEIREMNSKKNNQSYLYLLLQSGLWDRNRDLDMRFQCMIFWEILMFRSPVSGEQLASFWWVSGVVWWLSYRFFSKKYSVRIREDHWQTIWAANSLPICAGVFFAVLLRTNCTNLLCISYCWSFLL